MGTRDGTPLHVGVVGGILSIVLALLQFGAVTYTAYVCAGLIMYGMFIIPGLIGLSVTFLLFGGSVTASILALAKNPRQYLAIVGLVLSVLAFGGVVPGCRKGAHDSECKNSLPGNPKCAAAPTP